MAIAAFPAIAPSARGWQPGIQPSGVFTSLSGYETRISYGAAAVGANLSLSWNVLKEADALRIVTHFGQSAGTEVFSLPSTTWAGMSSPPGGLWRYDGAPSVTWLSPGLASVQVSLVQVLN